MSVQMAETAAIMKSIRVTIRVSARTTYSCFRRGFRLFTETLKATKLSKMSATALRFKSPLPVVKKLVQVPFPRVHSGAAQFHETGVFV